MKPKHYFALLAAIGLTSTISFAQSVENQNPYAIFGNKPYVAGAEQERTTVFVIENFAEDSEVARLEHDTETGLVRFFDFEGTLVDEKQLAQGERAWLQQDPLAEKYYSISPYAFSANNPVRYVDPNGEDWYEYTELVDGEEVTKYAYHDQTFSRKEMREMGYTQNVGLVAFKGGEYLSMDGMRMDASNASNTIAVMQYDYDRMGVGDINRHMGAAESYISGLQWSGNMPTSVDLAGKVFVVSSQTDNYMSINSRDLRNEFNNHLHSSGQSSRLHPVNAPRWSGDFTMLFEFAASNAYAPKFFPPTAPNSSTRVRVDRSNANFLMGHYRNAGIIR